MPHLSCALLATHGTAWAQKEGSEVAISSDTANSSESETLACPGLAVNGAQWGRLVLETS